MAENRWDAFTLEERMNLHHALRMVVQHPMVSEKERKEYTALADEIWTDHGRRVAEETPRG